MSQSAQTHLPPSSSDMALARQSGEILSKHLPKKKPLKLVLQAADQGLELPAPAAAILMEILQSMAAGRAITIIPQNAELTTVEAANMLNVSRPHLIKLLEDKKIPFRKVGTHRRILVEDIVAFKNKLRGERESALDELAGLGQELAIGY
jgi:excisionase family DNA binding protein